MKKILLQFVLDEERKVLQLGLAEEIKSEDKEYIMATLELLGDRLLKSIGVLEGTNE